MGFRDRIERSMSVAHPPAKVWEGITTDAGLDTWFAIADRAVLVAGNRGIGQALVEEALRRGAKRVCNGAGKALERRNAAFVQAEPVMS